MRSATDRDSNHEIAWICFNLKHQSNWFIKVSILAFYFNRSHQLAVNLKLKITAPRLTPTRWWNTKWKKQQKTNYDKMSFWSAKLISCLPFLFLRRGRKYFSSFLTSNVYALNTMELRIYKLKVDKCAIDRFDIPTSFGRAQANCSYGKFTKEPSFVREKKRNLTLSLSHNSFAHCQCLSGCRLRCSARLLYSCCFFYFSLNISLDVSAVCYINHWRCMQNRSSDVELVFLVFSAFTTLNHRRASSPFNFLIAIKTHFEMK